MSPQRPPIFDDGTRSDPAPARHAEGTFAFLNRVAGTYWDHPRRLVQSWADHIADDVAYTELRSRLRSTENHTNNSAFLELYLHEMLLAGGYTVTIHPPVPGTARRPDLHAAREDHEFYLEAILPGATPAARAATNRRRRLFDTIDAVGDPNFFLWLDELTEGPGTPSGAALRKELRTWLSNLHPDGHPDIEHAPTHRWHAAGWSATFKAIPKAPHARGPVQRGDRAIGVYAHTEAAMVDDAPTIQGALAEKHHAYGNLNAPFIIAVGQYIFDTDRWHSTAAMYGTESIQFGHTADGQRVTRQVRQPNGYFGAPPHWANRHVSAVLLVNQLQSYSVPRAEVTLWQHPAATHPLPPDLPLPTQNAVFNGSRVTISEPLRSAPEHFDLPSDWPPGSPWP